MNRRGFFGALLALLPLAGRKPSVIRLRNVPVRTIPRPIVFVGWDEMARKTNELVVFVSNDPQVHRRALPAESLEFYKLAEKGRKGSVDGENTAWPT